MTVQEEIIKRISERLQIDANLLEGGFAQDIIGSISYELANITETELNRIADKAFVTTAQGEDLDRVGADYGIERRQDAAAIVYLEITGDEFAVINQNVKAIYNNLVYTVQEYKKINSSGVARVKAKCDTLGVIGNVPADTITQFLTNYAGLRTVTNPEPSYDGFDKEDDEIYRQRIIDYLASDSANCNKEQYETWAREVTGVLKAVVKGADEGMGAGNVGVFISAIDTTVSDELKQTVHDYIAQKQFINATLIVDSLNYVNIDVEANVILKEGYSNIDIADQFKVKLKNYLNTVEKVVSYFKISELLFDCDGLEDVTDYTLNGFADSVTLQDTDFAVVGEVQIVAG